MNQPNSFESVQPCSGSYSFRKDLSVNAWFGVATLVYLVGRLLLRAHPEWSPGWRAAITLAPLLPGLLHVRAWVCFVRGMDELQRRIQLQAWLAATGGTLFVTAVVNTLNASGVTWKRLPHGIDLGSAFLLTFFLWMVGWIVANRRYQ